MFFINNKTYEVSYVKGFPDKDWVLLPTDAEFAVVNPDGSLDIRKEDKYLSEGFWIQGGLNLECFKGDTKYQIVWERDSKSSKKVKTSVCGGVSYGYSKDNLPKISVDFENILKMVSRSSSGVLTTPNTPVKSDGGNQPNIASASGTDQVNHPKHYTSDDCGVEAIELTSLLPCCISNALKYVWRCGKKDEDLQELKKAEWYLEYSISNNLPSSIEGLSDTLDFEILVNKVKGSWVGDKYMFIDAMYWGNQELMLKAVKGIINGVQTVEK